MRFGIANAKSATATRPRRLGPRGLEAAGLALLLLVSMLGVGTAVPQAAPTNPQTVWRFRSTSVIGSYLWTANLDEKAAIITHNSKSWVYEGPAFEIDTSNPLNSTQLWRFRNKKDGTYFYTADLGEKANLVNNQSATWVLEGPAWDVSVVQTSMPVWRFRCLKSSGHLWTNSPAEKTRIENMLKTTWKLEGVAYYFAPGQSIPNTPDPATGFLLNGRQLAPQGAQVTLGNFPTGGAVTSDGRFLWTVSTGQGFNDIRVVDTTSQRVIQTIQVPSASGGIALDSTHHLAYLSGVMISRWQPSLNGLLGASGNCILVYSWSPYTGQAHLLRSISVQPQVSPLTQAFPVSTPGYPGSFNAWPQELSVSPDGSRLLVPLNLADNVAVVNLNNSDQVTYVPMGGGTYPFGSAITPDGRIGLVSNEGSGTLSVVDMQSASNIHTITVGPPLSHPESIVIDSSGSRAYVALTNTDQVVVVDLGSWTVERTISVGRSAGLGTMPVALAISPDGSRLFVAESGADAIGVIRLPDPQVASPLDWSLVGHIPTSEDPQVVMTTVAQDGRAAQLLYVAARGMGFGPNATGPDPTVPTDPIFWAFNPIAPTTDVFAPSSGVTYLASYVMGRAGLMPLPSDAQIEQMTPAALHEIQPVGAQVPPIGTPLRAGGPIKHVFFLVRENRSYDQLLGDVARGNGDVKLAVFGQNVTPNMHGLVTRFPLLDHVFANSEASIQGHFWTAGATVPDYVDRNWVHEYAGRLRPNDFGVYAITFPGNGFLFNQAERQGISYFNYGEGMAGDEPEVEDRNNTPQVLADKTSVAANSDLGPGLTAPSAIPFYPNDLGIGQVLGSPANNPQAGEVFDSSLASLTAQPSPGGYYYSHIDSFRARFNAQLASDSVPTFNYLCMMSDHTRGTQPGFPTPTAMVADGDLGLGQLVETISHSSIWDSSVIFVVEDDSQDGADHVDAHRIPVAVISPYALPGAVVHTRYDLPSVVRSMELIMGMQPLSLNDAMATPMYDAFSSQPLNSDPYDAVPPNIDLQSRNTTASPWAAQSSKLPLDQLDAVPQSVLDGIIWKSVHGADSTPPPPGPNAEGEK